jgi:hypothetical protein
VQRFGSYPEKTMPLPLLVVAMMQMMQELSCLHPINQVTTLKTIPLSPRTQCQIGFEIIGRIPIIATICLLAAVLRLIDGSHLQVVLAAALTVLTAADMHAFKIVRYHELWQAHTLKMDDKRVASLSFQVATALLTLPSPLFSTILTVMFIYSS